MHFWSDDGLKGTESDILCHISRIFRHTGVGAEREKGL